jgi:hypothetical protein
MAIASPDIMKAVRILDDIEEAEQEISKNILYPTVCCG